MASFVYKKDSSCDGDLPSCCICGIGFYSEETYWAKASKAILHRQGRLYTIRKLLEISFLEDLEWHCFYRIIMIVLHNTRNDTFRVSGVALNMAVNCRPVPEAVPWDESMGVIGYPENERDRLVLAIGLYEDEYTSSHGLVGHHVHNSCWELLTHHTIGETARNLALVSRNPNLFADAFMDCLPPDDVENAQIAMKYYLGDAYWRIRAPIKLFHEVRSVRDETLDWQFLCKELARLSQTPDLAFRQYIIDRLDGLQAGFGQATNE
ncbi:hypothetical protein BDV38DRAFT_271262 [Aspergillus pseudotamarii]|uniref:Uncharacterized protein n=1 Tax=Aspergillus pseudotamarii TaxID=132259 RepID=A0A5N6SRT2_ASPPS|nr:uncharacterized protein BDV38DRAFT_271262 [Aspergillus pseudotamarii]KAE8137398.1 hypothetical protein BDV38DRAFT_271262 [Aspergillus pseudotamarii]